MYVHIFFFSNRFCLKNKALKMCLENSVPKIPKIDEITAIKKILIKTHKPKLNQKFLFFQLILACETFKKMYIYFFSNRFCLKNKALKMCLENSVPKIPKIDEITAIKKILIKTNKPKLNQKFLFFQLILACETFKK
jgi:hypothetical protein